MVQAMTTSVVRQLGVLFEGGSAAGLSDRQLIERFVAGRDSVAAEAAFSALVSRHGPMVLGVCQQLLGDRQHAEDAFQAVFLVLARRARSVRDPDLLSHWLYGVALRTARKARGRLSRLRRSEEDRAVDRPEACSTVSADQALLERERAEALHAEIDRLPASSRLPIVLCYFEGLSLAEAARRLRCPAGTVHSRLVRAREKLRRGLIRRGVVLSTTAMAAALAPRSASASVSPLLCDITTRAAIQFAARHAAGGALAAPATALAQEVLHTMLIHKLKLTAISLLLLAAVATGAGWLARSMAMKDDPAQQPAAPVAKVAPHGADRPGPAPRPDPAATARMTVTGRVLDPDGKPVTGAFVEVVSQLRTPWVGASEETFGMEHALLGQGRSDGDGRFRLDATRMASVRVIQIYAMAAAPGYGLGWVRLNPYTDQPTADIRLLPEQPIRIRLVDVIGRPAHGVEVRVRNLRRDDKGTDDDVWFWDNPPRESRIWPRPATTDDQGRLTLPGLGRGVNVNLGVRDLRYARQELDVDSSKATSKETTRALEPARIIEGRVLAADTGQPIPNAIVSATTLDKENVRGYFTTKFRADDQGRFVMNPIAGESYTLAAFPTGGEPYLIQQVEFPWPKGAVKATRDIKLPRGVLIRGKVTEAGTNRPLAASSIQFNPMPGGDDVVWGWQAIVASREDGSFQIAVPPRKGHLLVFGPTGDYVLGEIRFDRLYRDWPGPPLYYAHAIIPYEAKAGDPPHEVSAALRTGVTIRGRVEGPEVQTVTDGFILTTLHIEPFSPFWRGEYDTIRDGRFELHGLDPEGSTRVHVLDPDHKWGATVEVSGKQAGEDMTIRLEPCGMARARFVGPDGKPVVQHRPHVEIVVTSGPSRMSRNEKDQAERSADTEMVANAGGRHYGKLPHTDAEGRITLGSLIPGARYRIVDYSTVNQVRKDFTVKAGETVDLGDLLIQKPAS